MSYEDWIKEVPKYQQWLREASKQPQNKFYLNIAKFSYELVIDSLYRSQGLIARDLGIQQSALSYILKTLRAQRALEFSRSDEYKELKKGQHGNDNTSQL